MKILIAADMEGISGVVVWDQVNPNHNEYNRFRQIMTSEVNAAVRGAFKGGADEVIVSDGHDNACNIMIENLDPRAKLNSGSPAPLAMVKGVDQDVDGLIFVGYHACAGTRNAILAHTWSGSLANVWLNDQLVGEIGLNAAVAGSFGVPLLLITGDQSACKEAEALIPGVEKVEVKQAAGRMTAECLPLEAAHQKIEKAAENAVKNLKIGNSANPFNLNTPITLVIEFFKANMADRAAIIPGAIRIDGRKISYQAPDALSMYQIFQAFVGLAK